jgi:hypothetical protein
MREHQGLDWDDLKKFVNMTDKSKRKVKNGNYSQRANVDQILNRGRVFCKVFMNKS